jgi:hypothetical protein
MIARKPSPVHCTSNALGPAFARPAAWQRGGAQPPLAKPFLRPSQSWPAIPCPNDINFDLFAQGRRLASPAQPHGQPGEEPFKHSPSSPWLCSRLPNTSNAFPLSNNSLDEEYEETSHTAAAGTSLQCTHCGAAALLKQQFCK